MDSDYRTRKQTCECSSDLFERTFDFDDAAKPIWKCTNCGRSQKRIEKSQPTNSLRGFSKWKEIKDAWKQIDSKLYELVDQRRIASGALLVYTSSSCGHLESLVDTKKKLSNTDIHVCVKLAYEDLERAKKFLAKKEE